jgi:epoxyqueuosine reductase
LSGLYPEELIHHETILDKVEIYTDPLNSFPEAKSIISMVFRYHFKHPTDLTKPGEPHGVLARAYHRDIYGEMFRMRGKFAEHLQRKGVMVAEKTYVPHKTVAVRAGVGWQGKNSLILTEEFGSWLTLTSLVVDKEFEPDKKSSKTCGSCQACLRACPTSAIQAPGIIDVNRCIDYLTCKTGIIPRKLRSKMGNRIVSCDRCQEVCPYNKDVKTLEKEIPCFDPVYQHSPSLLPLLNISEEEFKKYYLHCDFIDPCKESLQRNVFIALGNIGDPIAISVLQRFRKSTNALLREHAEWAIRKINNKVEIS